MMGWPNNYVQGVYNALGSLIGVYDGAGGQIGLTPTYTEAEFALLDPATNIGRVLVNDSYGSAVWASDGVRWFKVNDKTDFTLDVTLGVIGQSNEYGTTFHQDALGAWRFASVSAPSQGIHDPVELAPAGHGSMFNLTAELLAKDGIKVRLINGSLGGASMIDHFAGAMITTGRANNTAYRGRRASLGAGDPGTKGQVVIEGGNRWECTTGNKHLAFLDSETKVTVAGANYYNQVNSIVVESTLLSHATVKPTFTGSPTAETSYGALDGTTVVDGALTWMCVQVGGSSTADSGSTRIIRLGEVGFDPYFAMNRLKKAVNKTSISSGKKFVYIQNGQSDAGKATILYTTAIAEVVRYFSTATDYPSQIPIVGLSLYYPASSKANYDLIETSLSSGGYDAPPDYGLATSPLRVRLASLGHNMGTPGASVPAFAWYFGVSLYRALGLSVSSLLNTSDNIHTNLKGVKACAEAIAPTLSKIIRNSAI